MASLPVVMDENLQQLLQLNMHGSVGWGGKNLRDDVTLLQTLLNMVTPQDGGPATKMKVDGASGPFTVAAISGFQSPPHVNALPQADIGVLIV